MLLKGKTCVIVGAASPRGIGNAAVELFAEHGARVVAVDIAMDELTGDRIRVAVKQKLGLGCDVSAIRCDIVNPGECEDLFDQVVARHGTIDSLVNCAGIVSALGMLETGASDYDRVIDANLRGAFNLCQGALRRFREQKGGTIVNVASLAAQRGGGLLGGTIYSAAKGGVISLTRSIAREFGPLGIRANVVCPAMIETSMLDKFSEERFREIVSAIPLRRVGLAREAAGACLFLASDLSGYITGATIDVNGGSHIH
jgi:NAD(P)-dependent dehydrogenase (short-subunit alcohol dehydrogenase family)